MENSKIIGYITNEEVDEIYKISQRKNALVELLGSLGKTDADTADYLYSRIVNDLQDTNKKMQMWWAKMSLKYNWNYDENYNWSVNFKTAEVSVILNNVR